MKSPCHKCELRMKRKSKNNETCFNCKDREEYALMIENPYTIENIRVIKRGENVRILKGT